MKRGGKAFLLILVALAGIAAIIVIAVALSRGVESGTVVELTLSGTIMEERDASLYGRLFQGDVTLTREITETLRKAARDDQVAGVMAVIKPFHAGSATVEEIRDAVLRFRDSGKWTVAYMDGAGELTHGSFTYWLASSFEHLTMSPAGDVNLVGVMVTVPFLRGVLDNLKIYPDMHHIGPYKSAKNIYTEKGFTDAHRESTESVVSDIFQGIVEGISRSRGMTVEEVEALVDRGPFLGQEALDAGLVDKLGYFDEFMEDVKERVEGRLVTLSAGEYRDRRSGFAVGSHKIALIHGTGTLVRGSSAYDPAVGFLMGSETVTGAIREAREDPTVKGIILRIDSPGGSALASDVIWREVDLARQEKPVVASFGDLAASGGYYVSCSADRIIAHPSSLTGSIGVVYGKMVTGGLYNWMGMTFEEVQRGRNAHLWSELHRWTPEERAGFTDKFIQAMYDRFVARVSDGRGMTREEVDEVGQGRVWSGRRAVKLGLVDELGGWNAAIEAVKELAGIPEEEDIRIVVLPEKEPWWRTFWGGMDRSTGETPTAATRAASMILEGVRPLFVAALFDGEPALLSPTAVALDSP